MKNVVTSIIDAVLNRRGQQRVYLGHDRKLRSSLSNALAYECLIRQLIVDRAVDVVVDVGANEGQFARFVRSTGFSGPILSFEPIPETCARLRGVAQYDDAWHVFEYALGDADGSASAFTYPASDWNSLVPRNVEDRHLFKEELLNESALTVQVRTLDSISPELPVLREARRCFLKIDTEGFDAHVLRGAERFIDQHVTMIQMELSSPTQADSTKPQDGPPTLAFAGSLAAMGFSVCSVFPVSHEPGTPFAHAFDCIAARRIELN